MAQPDIPTASTPSGSLHSTTSRQLEAHLARSDTSALITLLGTSTMELLSTLGPDVTSPTALAYFIVNLHGQRGALRKRDIRSLLLSKLDLPEATELCVLLNFPAVTPLRTLSGIDFDAAPLYLELLGRWYGLANDELEAPLQASEASQKAVAAHKLDAHQLNAFRELRRAIAHPPVSVLVHMPFGAGKLRLVATATLDLFRSEANDRSIIWLAPGAAMCEEAFIELEAVWRQLGSRDTTILRLYGDRPMRDLDQLSGAIAVIDILRLTDVGPTLEKLGSVTSVAVLADAENLVHPAGIEIIRRMSLGGAFSVVGILAPSGTVIPPGTARDALKDAFPDACITIGVDDLQSLREAGDFTDINGAVVHLTKASSTNALSQVPSAAIQDCALEFDCTYVSELCNNVERNECILAILKNESKGM